MLADVVAAERARFWRGTARLTVVIALLALAVGLALAAMLFLLVGVYRSLSATMPPWQAGTVIGCVGLLLAIIVMLGVALVIEKHNRPRKILTAATDRNSTGSKDAAGELGSAIGEIIANSSIKTTDMVLTALIAGIVLGISSGLRGAGAPGNKKDRKTAATRDSRE